MTDKDLGEGLENLEQGVENLKNKEFRVFGIRVTFMTVTALLSVVGAVIGSLYGGFLMYQKVEEAIAFVEQQQEYEEKINGYDQRMQLVETKLEEAVGYTNEIKNDLKGDIRRVESVVERVERNSKETVRDVNEDLRSFRVEMKTLDKDLRDDMRRVEKQMKEDLQEALDNPLNDMN